MTHHNQRFLLTIQEEAAKGKTNIKGKVGGDWGEILNPTKQLTQTESSEFDTSSN